MQILGVLQVALAALAGLCLVLCALDRRGRPMNSYRTTAAHPVLVGV
ncbi:hypothetical protein [Streptomyces canus]|nr:hypothetical protein [Streptomyces canus]WSD83069.1 hypothetical protein OG925_01325 [Streptomyces canus]